MAKAKPELEKATKSEIKALLTKLWPDVWQIMVVPGGFGTGGIPDHLACAPVVITPEMVGKTYGMFVSIEAKKPKGELRGLQRIFDIVRSGKLGRGRVHRLDQLFGMHQPRTLVGKASLLARPGIELLEFGNRMFQEIAVALGRRGAILNHHPPGYRRKGRQNTGNRLGHLDNRKIIHPEPVTSSPVAHKSKMYR